METVVLDRIEFVPNVALENKKSEYDREYDILFFKILYATKGSTEHSNLLLLEEILHNRTSKFLRDNSVYFTNKRRHIIERGNLG